MGSRPRTFCRTVVSGGDRPRGDTGSPLPTPFFLSGLIPLVPPPFQGEGRREARAPRAWGWGGARGSAAAVQLRRSMAGGAAHLLVWRPGPRGGRASGRAGRRAVEGPAAEAAGGARSAAAARNRTLHGGGGVVERAAAFHAIRSPAGRLTDRRDRVPPTHPRPFWPTAALSPSLSGLLSPGVLREEEKKFFFKLQNQRLQKREREGGGERENSTLPMRMRGEAGL